ncbi:hypothetical protein ABPG74_002766 [Tetrahymena malaccensis]
MRIVNLISLATVILLLGATVIYTMSKSQQINLNDPVCIKYHRKQSKEGDLYYGENICNQPLKFEITVRQPIASKTSWFTIDTPCLKNGDQYLLNGFLPQFLESEYHEEC